MPKNIQTAAFGWHSSGPCRGFAQSPGAAYIHLTMSAAANEQSNIIRNQVELHRHGVLSTISQTEAEYPFGSIVPYDVDEAGDIIIYVSFIAEHYKNLARSSKASLLIADPWESGDPQSSWRTTLVLDFTAAPDHDGALRRSYEAKFPGSINHELAHNFLFMRGRVKRIRWIAGFGEMGWIDGERFRLSPPDPVARSGWDIVSHMNEDHADALLKYLQAFAPPKGGFSKVLMTSVSSQDFTLRALNDGEAKEVVIPLHRPIKAPGDARAIFIELLREAESRLRTPKEN